MITKKDILFGVIVISLGVSIGLSIGFYEVTSGSMEPQIEAGNTVFVFHSSHDVFIEDSGSIIVFKDSLQRGSEKYILHRTVYYAEEGENWVEEVPDEHLLTQSCETETYCPAPHSGYITKGDANAYYDQSTSISPPVTKESIIGVHIHTFEWSLPEWTQFSPQAQQPAR
jgi:signal peptidase I